METTKNKNKPTTYSKTKQDLARVVFGALTLAGPFLIGTGIERAREATAQKDAANEIAIVSPNDPAAQDLANQLIEKAADNVRAASVLIPSGISMLAGGATTSFKIAEQASQHKK